MQNFDVGTEETSGNLKESIGRLKHETVSSANNLVSAFRHGGTAVRDYVEGHPGRVIVASLALGMLLGALGKGAAANGVGRSGHRR